MKSLVQYINESLIQKISSLLTESYDSVDAISKNLISFLNTFNTNIKKIDEFISAGIEEEELQGFDYKTYKVNVKNFKKINVKECNKLIKEINNSFFTLVDNCEGISFPDKTAISKVEMYASIYDRRSQRCKHNKQLTEFPNIKYALGGKKDEAFSYAEFLNNDAFNLQIDIVLDYSKCPYYEVIKKCMNDRESETSSAIRFTLKYNEDKDKYVYILSPNYWNNGKTYKFLYKTADSYDLLGEAVLKLINEVTEQNFKEIQDDWVNDMSEYLLPENAIEPLIYELNVLNVYDGWGKEYSIKDNGDVIKEFERIFQLVDPKAKLKVISRENKSGQTHQGFAPIRLDGANTLCELTYCGKTFKNVYINHRTNSKINMSDEYNFTTIYNFYIGEDYMFGFNWKHNRSNPHIDVNINKNNIRKHFK